MNPNEILNESYQQASPEPIEDQVWNQVAEGSNAKR
jgi:hypothetical protein